MSRREPDESQGAVLARLGVVGWARWDRPGRIRRAVVVLAVLAVGLAAVSVFAVDVAHAPTGIVLIVDVVLLAVYAIILGAFALYPEQATRKAALRFMPRIDELNGGRGVGWGGVPDPVEPGESHDHLQRRLAQQAETLAQQRAELLAQLPPTSHSHNDVGPEHPPK